MAGEAPLAEPTPAAGLTARSMTRVLDSLGLDSLGAAATLDVAGCPIRYRRLGRPGAPRLLLVHGGRAHGGWWSGVAPILANRFDVLVPDLSGHGDSGHRAAYGGARWAAELAAVVAGTGGGPVAVAGHSLGGGIGVVFAARHPRLVDALVMVDTLVRPPGRVARPPGQPARKRRYATVEAALAAFRLHPTAASPELLRELALASLTRVNGHLTWKFDPAARGRLTDEAVRRALPRVRCPVTAVTGRLSTLVGPGTLALVADLLGRRLPCIGVLDAYHHVPLDAPEACAAAIVAALGRT